MCQSRRQHIKELANHPCRSVAPCQLGRGQSVAPCQLGRDRSVTPCQLGRDRPVAP